MITFEVIALSPYARDLLAETATRRGDRFRDRQHRSIEIEDWQHDDWNGLLTMYGSFDLTQRPHGLTPLNPQQRAVWLEQLLSRGPNLVARHARRIVGHVALVAYDGGN